MTDTTPEIEALLRERFAAMTGAERALMALQMFETAQRIVLSSLPPGMSDVERRRELCRRFYGDELARQAYSSRAGRGGPEGIERTQRHADEVIE